tara:strand:- start:79 stop:1587 length:1509 start_codon:yes stop_codon:yes gene_type:complete
MFTRSSFLLIAFLSFYYSFSQDTITVATYNLLRYNEDTDRNIHFKKVIDEIDADIYIAQELSNSMGVSNFLNNVLNSDNEDYLSAEFFDDNDIDQALFYNKNKFNLLSTTTIPGDPRPILIYRLKHIQTEKIFFVFNMHLKASKGSSNEIRRETQVDQLINYTKQMTDDHFFIAAGDFNIYSTDEPAYRKFFESTSTGFGKFNDLIKVEGKYNDPVYAEIHTQSPRTAQFGGGASGGMDDRFDFILFSDSLFFGNKTFLIKESYTVYGNDGNHYNQAINVTPNTAVGQELADALHDASDHLPVYAEIIFSNDIVVPENNAPIANDTLFYVNETPDNNSLVGELVASDPEGDTLSYSIISGNNNDIFKIDDNGNILIKDGSQIIYEDYTSFVLVVEVSDGDLSDNSQVTINVIENIPLTFENIDPNLLNLFPNPVKNKLNIRSAYKNIKDFKILSSGGKKIISIKKLDKNNTIDFSPYNSGIYFGEFIIGKRKYHFKIIKKDL